MKQYRNATNDTVMFTGKSLYTLSIFRNINNKKIDLAYDST